MQDLHEIRARKEALTDNINSHLKQIEPLEKELKELETKEKELSKSKKKNEKDGAE